MMLVLIGVCVVVMRLGGVFVGDEARWVRRSKVRACVPFCEREEKGGMEWGRAAESGPQRGAEQLI